MGAGASMAGAMIQAKAQKDAARRMIEAQERAVAGGSPYGMGVNRLTSTTAIVPVAMVNCKGCGAPHLTSHFCEYCGTGKPPIPRVTKRNR